MENRKKPGRHEQAKLTGAKADEDMHSYLEIRDGPPAASTYDSDEKRQIFETEEKHQLMMKHWSTVFNKHDGAVSTWLQFLEK